MWTCIRFLSVIALIALLAVNASAATIASEGACRTVTRGGSSAVEIWSSAVATVYNAFPVRIGGVSVGLYDSLEDYAGTATDAPVCVCMRPTPAGPAPVPGITFSYWEPIAIVEPTTLPYCFPTLGTSIPLGFGAGAFSVGASGGIDATQKFNTFQAHYIKFPLFKMLEIFSDIICLDTTAAAEMDIGYFTEVDPFWQNDQWAALLGPEAYLVANPVAQAACMADAAAASAGFPLDPLWWCLGSWGSAFPMTMNVTGNTNPTAAAAVVSRLLMKMHRELLLWGSVGNQGLCGTYPMPVWRKSQYAMFPLFPTDYPVRIPVGRSGLLWESGQDIPMLSNGVWAWSVYRKRDCCAF